MKRLECRSWDAKKEWLHDFDIRCEFASLCLRDHSRSFFPEMNAFALGLQLHETCHEFQHLTLSPSLFDMGHGIQGLREMRKTEMSCS